MDKQKSYWDNLHKIGKVDHYTDELSSFAEKVNDIIPQNSKILELGCGVGDDSYYFAKEGHRILATDVSDLAIEKNKKRFQHKNLTFKDLNIENLRSIPNDKFDVIYARLSLHYFTDAVTKKIFKEISRILKTGGHFCFVVKSPQDIKYGKGTEIEKDMYNDNGHIRHFFSEEYAKECLGNEFEVATIQSGEEKFYKEISAFVSVIGRKIS